jgi:hypothetical protein
MAQREVRAGGAGNGERASLLDGTSSETNLLPITRAGSDTSGGGAARPVTGAGAGAQVEKQRVVESVGAITGVS